MDDQQALEIIFERNAFYRRQYLLALSALAMSIAVIGVLMAVLIYLIRTPVNPLYFATDKVGGLINIVPVRQQNMTKEALFAWAIDAVESAYSYDYINYRAELQSAQKYFTDYGWTRFRKALEASNNLYTVLQRKMIAKGVVTATPQVIEEGMLNGAYAWKLSIPLTVTYASPPFDDRSKFSNQLQISILIQRLPILQSYQGLGVVQLIATFVQTSSQQSQELSTIPVE